MTLIRPQRTRGGNTATSEWEGDRVFNWGEMGSSPPPEKVLGSTLQQPVSSFHCPLQDQDLSVHEVKGSQQSPSNPQIAGKAPGERPASRLSQFMPEQQPVKRTRSGGRRVSLSSSWVPSAQVLGSRTYDHSLTGEADGEALAGQVCVTGLCTSCFMPLLPHLMLRFSGS